MNSKIPQRVPQTKAAENRYTPSQLNSYLEVKNTVVLISTKIPEHRKKGSRIDDVLDDKEFLWLFKRMVMVASNTQDKFLNQDLRRELEEADNYLNNFEEYTKLLGVNGLQMLERESAELFMLMLSKHIEEIAQIVLDAKELETRSVQRIQEVRRLRPDGNLSETSNSSTIESRHTKDQTEGSKLETNSRDFFFSGSQGDFPNVEKFRSSQGKSIQPTGERAGQRPTDLQRFCDAGTFTATSHNPNHVLASKYSPKENDPCTLVRQAKESRSNSMSGHPAESLQELSDLVKFVLGNDEELKKYIKRFPGLESQIQDGLRAENQTFYILRKTLSDTKKVIESFINELNTKVYEIVGQNHYFYANYWKPSSIQLSNELKKAKKILEETLAHADARNERLMIDLQTKRRMIKILKERTCKDEPEKKDNHLLIQKLKKEKEELKAELVTTEQEILSFKSQLARLSKYQNLIDASDLVAEFDSPEQYISNNFEENHIRLKIRNMQDSMSQLFSGFYSGLALSMKNLQFEIRRTENQKKLRKRDWLRLQKIEAKDEQSMRRILDILYAPNTYWEPQVSNQKSPATQLKKSSDFDSSHPTALLHSIDSGQETPGKVEVRPSSRNRLNTGNSDDGLKNLEVRYSSKPTIVQEQRSSSSEAKVTGINEVLASLRSNLRALQIKYPEQITDLQCLGDLLLQLESRIATSISLEKDLQTQAILARKE